MFGDYGRYYDLLYADKDYAAEANYVAGLLARFGVSPCSMPSAPSSSLPSLGSSPLALCSALHAPCSRLLEFGSGTGRHGRLLVQHGYHVTGIERSEQMVAASGEQGGGSGEPRAKSSEQGAERGEFSCVLGDVRSTRVPGEFDAVISLFHVVSYQTGNEDVAAMFQNAARHLKPDGLFLFDVWYAPAVLAQQPQVRIKRVEDDAVHLTRIAEPTLHCDRNCVQVDYTLFIRNKRDNSIRSLAESHLMRYYSTPELQWIGQQQGLDLAHHEEWLTGYPPGSDTWGVCYVMRKQPVTPDT